MEESIKKSTENSTKKSLIVDEISNKLLKLEFKKKKKKTLHKNKVFKICFQENIA